MKHSIRSPTTWSEQGSGSITKPAGTGPRRDAGSAAILLPPGRRRRLDRQGAAALRQFVAIVQEKPIALAHGTGRYRCLLGCRGFAGDLGAGLVDGLFQIGAIEIGLHAAQRIGQIAAIAIEEQHGGRY